MKRHFRENGQFGDLVQAGRTYKMHLDAERRFKEGARKLAAGDQLLGVFILGTGFDDEYEDHNWANDPGYYKFVE